MNLTLNLRIYDYNNMLSKLIAHFNGIINRPNLFQYNEYLFEFPDKSIKKLEGRSPRNAFEQWRNNEIIKGNHVYMSYLDVKYLR